MLPGRKERSDISTARSAWRRPFRGSSICVATAHGPNIALSECQTAHEPRLRASATRLDRASASGADPAKSEIPENPVFVEIIEGQKRSQEVRKRLAGPETAGSTAGRDWVAAGHAARVRSVRQDRAHRATAWIPAARTAPSTDRLTPCPDAFPARVGETRQLATTCQLRSVLGGFARSIPAHAVRTVGRSY